MRPNTKNGFTLVELMMVVIIVGILTVTAALTLQGAIIKSKLTQVQIDIGAMRTGFVSMYAAGQEPPNGGMGYAMYDEDLIKYDIPVKGGDYFVYTYGYMGSWKFACTISVFTSSGEYDGNLGRIYIYADQGGRVEVKMTTAGQGGHPWRQYLSLPYPEVS